jgi:hypothetical protein
MSAEFYGQTLLGTTYWELGTLTSTSTAIPGGGDFRSGASTVALINLLTLVCCEISQTLGKNIHNPKQTLEATDAMMREVIGFPI